MSSGIGLNESRNDARKGTVGTEKQALQGAISTKEIVQQLENVVQKQGGEIQSLGHRVRRKPGR